MQSKKCSTFRSKFRKAKRKRSTSKQFKESEDDDPTDTAKSAKAATKKAHYRCVPCKKYFYEIRKYEAHIKEVHEGAKKPFQCKECDKAYKFHKTLIDHIATNHSNKPLESYKCEICNNMFKTQITLKTHIQNKHPESDAESRRVICDQCGFLAVNQISLKKHIKNRHTQAEELKCDECPKVFKNQYYLKYHKMNFHNPMNIKPFQCGQCDMAFTRQSLLNTHTRSHLDITERIKCDFEGCNVRFLQQAEKRRHMRLVHLKVKQYVCDICRAAFGTKPTLRHHRYIHTNEKPYKCNVCGQGFRQRSAMNHIARYILAKR